MPRRRSAAAKISSARPTNCAPSSRTPKLALAEAFEELKKVELLDERDQIREREAENAAEQAELDDIALMRVRGVAPA